MVCPVDSVIQPLNNWGQVYIRTLSVNLTELCGDDVMNYNEEHKPFGVLQFRRLRGGSGLLLFENTVNTSLKTANKTTQKDTDL